MIFDLNQNVFGGPEVLDIGRPGISFVRGRSSSSGGGGDVPSASSFLSQQITTQIDTEDPVENPMELTGISIPGISTTTTLIANTPISNDFEMNTLALPTITITTEVGEI